MSEQTSDRDPFEAVAESFLERYRAGERPSITEYAARHPELAEKIRRLLPALVRVEQDLSVEVDRAPPARDRAEGPSGRLGDYRIVREIGRGGMGVVYEAEQVSLGRRVALKVLPHQIAHDPKSLERFRREAKAAARLHHTNIVPVFEVGQEGETAYYAMQFIQGQGLDQVIDELVRLRGVGRNGQAVSPGRTVAASAPGPGEPTLGRVAGLLLTGLLANEEAGPPAGDSPAPAGPATTAGPGPDAISAFAPDSSGLAALHAPLTSAVLPGGAEIATTALSGRRPRFFRSVARIGRQAAQGLAYAHSRGIIHRDIKPSNLLLDHAGVVWITDFGLAKGDDEGLTQSGDILGTLRYMAPERFRGDGDARADIYALGLTLYELLTFRSAFETTDRLRMIERIKTEEPARPRSLDGRIPRDLETIVLKAIDKDPAQRYATADAMAEDLRRFLDDEPILARRASTAEQYWRWARRNPTAAALGGGLTAALVLATVGSLLAAIYFQHQEQTQKQLAANNRTLADASEASSRLAAKRADEIQQNLYFAEMNMAGQAAESSGGIGRVNELLGHWRPTRGDHDSRGWEWYYLRGIGPTARLAWPHRHDRLNCLSWSPDGSRLASGGVEGVVRIWDGGSGKNLFTLRGHSKGVEKLSWSPDGRRLASIGVGDSARIWDATTGREISTLRVLDGGKWVVSWSPDGGRLATTTKDGSLKIWDPDLRQETADFRGEGKEIVALQWDPDGRRLTSLLADGVVTIRDLDSGKETTILGGLGGPMDKASFSPDGQHLALSPVERPTITLWDLKAEHETATLRGHAGQVEELDWSPDSRHLASASSDQAIKIWERESGLVTATLRGHTRALRAVDWNPDGRRLASGGTDPWLMVWEPDLGRGPAAFRGHTDAVWAVRWSPDGQSLASGSLDNTVRIWDATTGRETAVLRGHSRYVEGVCWSPDGRRLASASHDQTVKLWDASSGEELATLRGHGGEVPAVSWSPDGRRLASGSFDGTVKLWDADTGRELANLPVTGNLVWAVSWSPDSRMLASAADNGKVKVWVAERSQPIATFQGSTEEVKALCWSPDGKRLASSGLDHRVHVWDLASGNELASLSGHTDWVMGVDWSPDGHRLASASNDGTVKIWDPDTGQETATLRGYGDRVNAVHWSPDGQRLASASWNRAIRIWDASPGYISERSPVLLPGLERRLAVHPQSAPDLRLRAEIHARLGQWDKAASDWSQAAHLQESNESRWFQSGWWVAGPVEASPADVAEPEAEPDLFQPVLAANPGESGATPLHWRAATGSANGYLDLGALFPNARSVFARTLLRVYAPHQQPVTAQVGSTSSFRFWLNGRLMHEQPQAHPEDSDDRRVPLTLRAGWNTLLFQVEVGNERDWLFLALE